MPDSRTSPSGSRWEPTPGPDVEGPASPSPRAATTTGPDSSARGPRRRRRGPVLVALVALLGVGGLGAGAYAYERSAVDTPAAASVRGTGGRADGAERHDGGHHRSGADDTSSARTGGGR